MQEYMSISELILKAKRGSNTSTNEIQYRLRNATDLELKGMNVDKVIYSDKVKIRDYIVKIYETIPKLSNLKMTQEQIIEEGYYSATIEGARTTIDEVKRCFNNPVSKDDTMVIQTIQALNYALNNDVTEDNIAELWEIIIKNSCENESVKGSPYRTGMVYISDGFSDKKVHTPPTENEVEDYMKYLFRFKDNNLETIVKSIILHYYLAYVHPFCDGNGRTARILMEQVLYTDVDTRKLVSINISRGIFETRRDYYRYLQKTGNTFEYEGKRYLDLTPFIIYMLDVIYNAMVRQINTVRQVLTTDQLKLYEKMKKNSNNTQITVLTACKIMKNSSKEKARRDLNRLTDLGILTKSKVGNINVYTLN